MLPLSIHISGTTAQYGAQCVVLQTVLGEWRLVVLKGPERESPSLALQSLPWIIRIYTALSVIILDTALYNTLLVQLSGLESPLY